MLNNACSDLKDSYILWSVVTQGLVRSGLVRSGLVESGLVESGPVEWSALWNHHKRKLLRSHQAHTSSSDPETPSSHGNAAADTEGDLGRQPPLNQPKDIYP
jgi:hypothetical protein